LGFSCFSFVVCDVLEMGLTSPKLLLAEGTGDGIICDSCVSGAVLSDASVACDSYITCGATSACVT
jgi:hypothetical protein